MKGFVNLSNKEKKGDSYEDNRNNKKEAILSAYVYITSWYVYSSIYTYRFSQ